MKCGHFRGSNEPNLRRGTASSIQLPEFRTLTVDPRNLMNSPYR